MGDIVIIFHLILSLFGNLRVVSMTNFCPIDKLLLDIYFVWS